MTDLTRIRDHTAQICAQRAKARSRLFLARKARLTFPLSEAIIRTFVSPPLLNFAPECFAPIIGFRGSLIKFALQSAVSFSRFLNPKPIIGFFAVLLNFHYATEAVAQGFGPYEPSTQRAEYCRGLVRRNGAQSVNINRRLNVNRPHAAAWRISRVNSPWRIWGGVLFYVFEQQTSDGFTHTAVCSFEEWGGALENVTIEIEDYERRLWYICGTLDFDRTCR